MDLFLWIFLSLVFLCWIFGWILSARFRTVPPLAPGAPRPLVKISIIIPARDEEENLSRLLPSLQDKEFAAHEIIVVNDQSADNTAGLATSLGAKVIDGKPLPAGWYGKPWACRQGAGAATGDWFLFLDADTVLEAGGLLRIADLSNDPSSVHSICPYHRVRYLYEQLSAFFNVIMILGMNAFTLKGSGAKQVGLFGQALFISREQYEKVGGHEPVKHEVLENFHLSRFLSEAGYTCRCYLGRGTIWMRMFPTNSSDLVAGWSKGIVSGADNTPKSALIGISIWLSGLIMSVIALAFIPLASVAALYVILGLYLLGVIQSLYLLKNAGNFSVFSALFFPVGLAFYQAVFFRALRRRKEGGAVQWKGRNVT
ncbi:MAG: glycosyltransferase [Verrucomicrobiales bacterium]|nr:glycosyltransferase [Verrucomicrobiales bacterium]